VPVPPPDEQTVIADFLDRETAKIDALIMGQERLIALLKEKRQAVISHVVTKGLDPNSPMKDSGIEWLGEVPAHWQIIRLKWACRLIKDGTHLPPPRVNEGIPLLSVRNVGNDRFDVRDDDSLISEVDYAELCRAFIPMAGDVLLAIVGATLGKSAVVQDGLGQFHIQRSLAIFRTAPSVDPGWLHSVFVSDGFQHLLWQHVGYSAQPGIYLGALADFAVPLPPASEQSQIIAFVGVERTKLDGLTSEAEKAIQLLQERRSALISAAVTGKIDVRKLAPAEAEAA
jgi:type I restriction enzyme S subunit